MYQLTKEVLSREWLRADMRFQIMRVKGKECIHNLGYWSGIPYLGFGLGASSYFEGTRFSNERELGTISEKSRMFHL